MSDKSRFAVELKRVTVSFRSYKGAPNSFKESLVQLVKTGKLPKPKTFDALSDVNLSIEKGTVFGVIGSNGAGKSTFLRTISGVLKPRTGKVIINGSLGSLIKLGAGFDLELNAIENIYLYCSLHGKNRAEIKPRIASILEYAELEEFADTPIKYYSSGMFARLGFSCALDMDPDILLVDEVLSVGDERFRKKCEETISELTRTNRTIIMVSHSLGTLARMASSIAVLSKGRIIYQGEPEKALEIYRDSKYETALDGRRL